MFFPLFQVLLTTPPAPENLYAELVLVQDGGDNSPAAAVLPALEQPQKQLADSARPPATGMTTIAFMFSVQSQWFA